MVREDSVSDVHAAERDAARELDDVERALAVLEGKDPDELKRLREARARAEDNFRKLAARIAANKTRAAARRKAERVRNAIRASIVVVLAGMVGTVGWVGMQRRQRWVALDRELDKLSEPYLARGFARENPATATASRVEIEKDAGACLIAVGVSERGAAHLRVEHAADVTTGDGAVAWCACGPQHVAITASADDGSAVGIRVLGAASAVAGGSLALPFLDPLPAALGGEAVDCSAADLDAWIAAKRWPKSDVPAKWFEDPIARIALQRVGATMVGHASAHLPFAVAEGVADGCYVALGGPEDELSLRIDGGRPLDKVHGPIAWCDPRGATSTVWRTGPGEVFVLGMNARRVGGMLGVREIARRAEIGEVTTWLAPENLGKDALDAILASGVTDGALFAPAPQGARPVNPRVIALSVLAGGSIAADPRTTVPWQCSPGLAPGASEAVCVQAGPAGWRQVGSELLGAGAEGSLPFWLSMLGTGDEPRLLELRLAMLRFARMLAGEGYEPTVLQGVTELPRGAEVLGRVDEDAIVAVGMTAHPPSVYPMTDSDPWSLDGVPHAVELHANQHVTVMPVGKVDVPPGERRTVVFRRREAR